MKTQGYCESCEHLEETNKELVEALESCLLYLDQEQFGPGDEPFDGNIREIICHAITKANGGGR